MATPLAGIIQWGCHYKKVTPPNSGLQGLGFAGQSAGFGSPQLCSPSTGKLAAAGAHHMGDGASAAAAQHRGASAPLGGWHRATCYERTATSEQKECEDAPGTTQGCTRSSDGDRWAELTSARFVARCIVRES